MKTVVRHAVALLAITAACQASLALAEEYYWTSGGNQAASLTGEQKTTEQAPTACQQGGCQTGGCDDGFGDPAFGCNCHNVIAAEDCPRYGIVGFAGLDSFKGISDGSFESNFGVVTGLNAATAFGDRGFGWQLGMSYGIYDVDGFGSTTLSRERSQEQTFVTTGFYRKAQEGRRLSYGIVYDWMVNNSWGVYGVNPTLGQWRGQIEYALSGCNSVGVWAAQRDRGSINESDLGALAGTSVETRAISQVNFFYHHKWNSGADGWIYTGLPDHGRLNGDASLLDWTIGAAVQVPLSDRLALYANGSYGHPSAAAGSTAAMESNYNIGMGIAWYFGGHARSNSLNGKAGLPYMPVANNSTFLVDQNPTF